MALTIAATDLHAGDYVKTAGKTVMLHRVPIDRSQPFTAGWMRIGANNNWESGEVSFDPDEQVEVVSRFPERVGI